MVHMYGTSGIASAVCGQVFYFAKSRYHIGDKLVIGEVTSVYAIKMTNVYNDTYTCTCKT